MLVLGSTYDEIVAHITFSFVGENEMSKVPFKIYNDSLEVDPLTLFFPLRGSRVSVHRSSSCSNKQMKLAFSLLKINFSFIESQWNFSFSSFFIFGIENV